MPPTVYYPKELGYENEEGSSSNGSSGSEVSEEEEEEWTPAMSAQKVI